MVEEDDEEKGQGDGNEDAMVKKAAMNPAFQPSTSPPGTVETLEVSGFELSTKPTV